MGGTPGLVPGRAELHEQLIARERLALQSLQALHVAAQKESVDGRHDAPRL
jgi:hypothetical protein